MPDRKFEDIHLRHLLEQPFSLIQIPKIQERCQARDGFCELLNPQCIIDENESFMTFIHFVNLAEIGYVIVTIFGCANRDTLCEL